MAGMRLQHLAIAKQANGTTGVDKHHVLILAEMALANQVDKPGSPFPGIDRVEKNAFMAGKRVSASSMLSVGRP
jgi:hypothetical protein